jgi:hypothetical protein
MHKLLRTRFAFVGLAVTFTGLLIGSSLALSKVGVTVAGLVGAVMIIVYFTATQGGGPRAVAAGALGCALTVLIGTYVVGAALAVVTALELLPATGILIQLVNFAVMTPALEETARYITLTCFIAALVRRPASAYALGLGWGLFEFALRIPSFAAPFLTFDAFASQAAFAVQFRWGPPTAVAAWVAVIGWHVCFTVLMAEGLLRRSALLVAAPILVHASANALSVLTVSSLGMHPVVAIMNWIVLAVLILMTGRLAGAPDRRERIYTTGAAAPPPLTAPPGSSAPSPRSARRNS